MVVVVGPDEEVSESVDVVVAEVDADVAGGSAVVVVTDSPPGEHAATTENTRTGTNLIVSEPYWPAGAIRFAWAPLGTVAG